MRNMQKRSDIYCSMKNKISLDPQSNTDIKGTTEQRQIGRFVATVTTSRRVKFLPGG